jgi:GNAT superfamily N-acetyltransferase
MNTYHLVREQERLILRNDLHSSFPIIQAVIEGVQQGQIFLNSHGDCWVLHKAGFSEMFLNDDVGIELVDFIGTNHSLPKYFHIYNPPEKLADFFNSRDDVFNVRERNRVQLTCEGQQKESGILLEEEFNLAAVACDNFDSLNVFNLDLASKFWNGKEDFVTNAMGVFVEKKNDSPVSLCYAAAVANQVAEIDVLTTENYRGKGFAKSLVSAFISICTSKNVIPNWDCFGDNIPSRATALGLGFKEKKLYNFMSVYRK